MKTSDQDINKFASPQVPVFLLTEKQIADAHLGLINQAIHEAIQPLRGRIAELERQNGDMRREQKEYVERVEARFGSLDRFERILNSQTVHIQDLEGSLEYLQEETARERAFDRQRIKKFEEEDDPQPLQKDRSDILKALLAANGGKMLLKEARQKMRMSRSHFSELLTKTKEIESRPYKLRRNQKILVLK